VQNYFSEITFSSSSSSSRYFDFEKTYGFNIIFDLGIPSYKGVLVFKAYEKEKY